MLEIARIAEKHDLIVISDEIYDRLVYSDHEHVMFASLPGMADRTVHLGGMSKDYAMTGWRIGYALGPADLIGAMRKIHQYLIMSAPTVGQEAALAALHRPDGRAVCAGDDRQLRRAPPPDRRTVSTRSAWTASSPRARSTPFPAFASTGMNEHEFCRAVAAGTAGGRDSGQRIRQGRRGPRALRLCGQQAGH